MKQRLSFVAAVAVCFFASNAAAYAQVRADTGGIAIGGSVTSSTVIIGIPQEKVDELVRDAKWPLEELTSQQRENIALLKEKLDLNERQVRAALGILGEKDIAPQRLAAKLIEIAERFKNLQATASTQPGDDPKIVALKLDTQKAVAAGELAKADALLADVEAEQRQSLDRLAVNAAETSAQRGDIALTRLRYVEAARHFAEAAAVFLPNSTHEDKRIGYLRREARALGQQGDEFGDNRALLAAVERLKQLAKLTHRDRGLLAWAETQNDLGVALALLGERKSETTKVEEAVAAYREALTELTSEPLSRAAILSNLGTALARLGERETGTARLEESVAAYRAALTELPRQRLPHSWARTQNNLAITLITLGKRENGTAKLEEAIAAYREVLTEWTRERMPFMWAAVQSNLGIGLATIGERQDKTAKLEEAIVAFREALKEQTRERTPLDWAMTQSGLGNALYHLADSANEMAVLEQAVAAYREALKEWTRERVPLDWATTQNSLGAALSRLGEGESGTKKLEDAVAAYREALTEQTRERAPLDWAMTQSNLGATLSLLGEREKGTAKLEEAVVAYREALQELTQERMPLDWATSFGKQGMLMMVIAERRRDAALAEAALGQIIAAFEALRDGGNASVAAYVEDQVLPRARDIVTRLRGQ